MVLVFRVHKHGGKAFGSVCFDSVNDVFVFFLLKKLEGEVLRSFGCHNLDQRVLVS